MKNENIHAAFALGVLSAMIIGAILFAALTQ